MSKKLWAVILTVAAILIAVIIISPDNADKPESETVSTVSANSTEERMGYFASHGWEVEEMAVKSITIPTEFSQAYEEYAEIQDRQGLPLRNYTGKNAELYIYSVKNYSPENKAFFAEMIVCDNVAVASLVYSEDGKNRLSAV